MTAPAVTPPAMAGDAAPARGGGGRPRGAVLAACVLELAHLGFDGFGFGGPDLVLAVLRELSGSGGDAGPAVPGCGAPLLQWMRRGRASLPREGMVW